MVGKGENRTLADHFCFFGSLFTLRSRVRGLRLELRSRDTRGAAGLVLCMFNGLVEPGLQQLHGRKFREIFADADGFGIEPK